MAEGFLSSGSGLRGASKQVNFYNSNDWALGEYIWEWAAINNPSMRMAATGRRDEHYFYQRQKTTPPQQPVPSGPFGAPDFDINPGQRMGRVDWNSQVTIEKCNEPNRAPNTYHELLNMTLTPIPWTNGENRFLRENDEWISANTEFRTPNSSVSIYEKKINVYHVSAPTEANEPLRRYEIIGSVIESRRRAQGRSVMKNVTRNVDIRKELWNTYADYSLDPRNDPGLNGTDNNDQRFSTHRFHSGEFNGTIMEQSIFWRRVLIETGTTTQAGVVIKTLTGAAP